MNLTDQIDQLFANASDEQLDALLAKGSCDLYNKVGTNFLSPEAAMREAERLRNTYQSEPVVQPPANESATWSTQGKASRVDECEEMPLAA